ncbi:hypothetical protein ACIQOW_01745 [Kitasatospora sp. NPDC091335]|uniref:hypothetical protein n=1 Tax=Kitasatospora sp. NPDC091335 TaxID=3364085 RepID=UPI0037FA0F8B
MTDQQNSAPAVWDPTARGGAGGWVRGPQRPADPQPAPGAPRPGSPGYDPPTARLFPGPTPPPPAAPPAAAPFPSHADPRTPAPPYETAGHDYHLQPPVAPPPPPPYGARPDYPTGPGDDEDRPADRRTPLLIGFALLLVLAIGGGLLFAARGGGDKGEQAAPPPVTAPPTGSDNLPPTPAPTGTDAAASASASASGAPTGTPSPTATGPGPGAQAQAQALDGLLSEGESAKAPIGSAVAKVTSCPPKADIESAAQVFDSGASQRAALLTKLSQLSVTDVPGGADAVNSLKSAWQLSSDIDKAYASWARAVAAQGCTGRAPANQDKKRADELNPQATQAKTDFMNKWNPIAKNYGLTPRTQDRI